MWILGYFRRFIKGAWFDAQGVRAFYRNKWNDKSLFRKIPPRCQICGDKWRPDKDCYVAVWGEIIETVFGNKWYCDQLGLVRDTGHLDAHPRYVCRDCGEWPSTKVMDCFTGEYVILRPRKAGIKKIVFNLKRDVVYWSTTTAKFVSICARELFCAISKPKMYYMAIMKRKELGL